MAVLAERLAIVLDQQHGVEPLIARDAYEARLVVGSGLRANDLWFDASGNACRVTLRCIAELECQCSPLINRRKHAPLSHLLCLVHALPASWAFRRA